MRNTSSPKVPVHELRQLHGGAKEAGVIQLRLNAEILSKVGVMVRTEVGGMVGTEVGGMVGTEVGVIEGTDIITD